MSNIKVISLDCHTCGGELSHISGEQYQCRGCRRIRRIENYTPEEMILLQQADINRSHHMRYVDAIEGYQAVLKINSKNVSALWGMFLSEYGIEYVKDIDGTYKPTFHRLSRSNATHTILT